MTSDPLVPAAYEFIPFGVGRDFSHMNKSKSYIKS